MKKLMFGLMITFILLGMYACQKTFLQQPNVSGNVSIATIFSNSLNATSELLNAYQWALGQQYMNQSNTGVCMGGIAGEESRGYSWQFAYTCYATGLSASSTSWVNYGITYQQVRELCIIRENIDKVPDMDAVTKGYVKAECQGLMAQWYMLMFKDFGGVPLVNHSYVATDNMNIPRATLQQTLTFTESLCDSAIAGLPDSWPAAQFGRLTKGSVMALKAQLLIFAARPLFNSSTPYLPMSNSANNNMICFGNTDPKRWDSVITASNIALAWCKSQGLDVINTGGAGVGKPNPNALNDYGMATSLPGPTNTELILNYQNQNNSVVTSGPGFYYDMSAYWTASRYDNALMGTPYNFLKNYLKSDGTEQSWPQLGDATPRPGSDYVTRFKQMEPRWLADHAGPGNDAANNPGDAKWTAAGWGQTMSNSSLTAVFPQTVAYGNGCGTNTKFYWHAGSRVWPLFPVYRVAELYLNLAEAYNEEGQTALALQNLNVVHNRAGLPSITITDQASLRTAIQREWAVEFYLESKRYFDVKHWKLPTIGSDILMGNRLEFQFLVASTAAASINLPSNLISYWNAVAYTWIWNPRMMLEPIPQSEVNKLIVVQNPGY